jgi:uncharacterized protein
MEQSVLVENEVEKRFVSWEEVREIVSSLCQGISRNDVDVICGISVGGLVPAALVSVELGEKNVVTLSSRSYQGFHQGEIVISNGPEVSALRGKRVLLVDDIMDSGNTIAKVRQHLLKQYLVQSVDVAVIYLNTVHCQAEQPEYWGKETSDWIVFPWEELYSGTQG